MAKCERPCWTTIFVGIWILVIPGVLLTHVSVITLVPPIGDLPINLAKGFDAVMRFAYMEADAMNIQTKATTILGGCQVTQPAVTCADSSLYPSPALASQQVSVDTAAAQAGIIADFNNSLTTVKMVANDKYLGTPDLKETATTLNNMTARIAEIQSPMKCYMAVPVFCGLYESANGIINGMATVNKAIDGFKNSDIVTTWDKRKGLLNFLHALPYFLILGMLIFSLFWSRGGVCCCCRGGTKCGLLLPIYAVLWLLSFLIYFIVFVVGLGIKYASDRINIATLNGNPTLKEAVLHLETNYPEFWALVFADMVKGLDLLFDSAFFFIIAALLIAIYSLLLCCCCPYRKKEDEAPKESA